MKRPTKAIIISLAAVLVAVLSGVVCLYRELQRPGSSSFVTVREFSLADQGSLAGWDEKALAPGETDYTLTELDGRKCLKASASDSASAFFYKEKLSFAERPFVAWDWKAGSFPARKSAESLDKKQEFDFVAQFYVIFYSRFFLKTKALLYVWTENIPAGTRGESPYTPNVKILVLESGPSDGWKREERDIAADYSTLFGEALDKDVVAVSFMTDADSTDSTAEAYFADVKLGYLGAGDGSAGKKCGFLEWIRKAVKSIKERSSHQVPK